MNIINLSVPAGVSSPVAECGAVMIGYVGEGGVTQVVLDVSAWAQAYGDGVVTLGIQRSGDPTWYPVVLEVDGTTAAWLVSKTDTSMEGMGVARFAYTVDGAEKRSAVWQFFVDRGLQSPEGDAPDPYESWVETLTGLGAETLQNAQDAQKAAEAAEQSAQDAAGSAERAETAKNAAGAAAAAAGESASAAGENAATAQGAAQAAQNAADAAEQSATDAEAAQQAAETAVTHYPKIVNDYWWVWDAERGEYVNTGVKAKGEDGDGAVLSVNGKRGTVKLDAEDVGALPDSSTLDDIPDGSTYKRTTGAQVQQISTNAAAIARKQETINASGVLKGNGAGGVSAATPGTDYLAPGALAPYRTAAAQDAIDAAQDVAIAGKYTKPGTGIPENDLAPDAQSKIDNALPKTGDGSNVTAAFTAAANRANISTGEKLSVIFGKIAKCFSDLGSAAFRAATGNITQGSTDLVESGAVYNGLSGKYSKPAGGIPKTDFTQAVQTSLGKADTALQSVPSTYRTAAAQDVIDSNKAPVILDTASGSIASFPDCADGLPLKTLSVNIKPVQSGTGDPSPTNVRPISGWTGCEIQHTGKNLLRATDVYDNETSLDVGSVKRFKLAVPNGTYTISTNAKYVNNLASVFVGSNASYDSSMGTSGNGINQSLSRTLTITNGIIVIGVRNNLGAGGKIVTRQELENEAVTIQVEYGSTATVYEPYQSETVAINWQSEAGTVYGGTVTLNEDGSAELRKRPYYASYNGETLVGPWLSSMDIYAEGTTPTIGAQVVDLGGDETVYQLTDLQVIDTLYGTNNIWADCGDVEVTYRADTKLYIQKINAPSDDDMTADTQIASGRYFIIGNTLYKSTTVIPAGDTVIPGTNCIKTNLAEALNALNT